MSDSVESNAPFSDKPHAGHGYNRHGEERVSDGSSSDASVLSQAFPGGASDQQSAHQCRRHEMQA